MKNICCSKHVKPVFIFQDFFVSAFYCFDTSHQIAIVYYKVLVGLSPLGIPINCGVYNTDTKCLAGWKTVASQT